MRDMKMWHNVAGVENVENSAMENQKQCIVLFVWIL